MGAYSPPGGGGGVSWPLDSTGAGLAATAVPLTVTGAVPGPQTANLIAVKDSAGTVRFWLEPLDSSNGEVVKIKTKGDVGGVESGLELQGQSGAFVPAKLVVSGDAGQLQVVNGSNEGGRIDGGTAPFQWLGAGSKQATVGAAGGAAGLPATPATFLRVRDDAGNVRVVPAYLP